MLAAHRKALAKAIDAGIEPTAEAIAEHGRDFVKLYSYRTKAAHDLDQGRTVPDSVKQMIGAEFPGFAAKYGGKPQESTPAAPAPVADMAAYRVAKRQKLDDAAAKNPKVKALLGYWVGKENLSDRKVRERLGVDQEELLQLAHHVRCDLLGLQPTADRKAVRKAIQALSPHAPAPAPAAQPKLTEDAARQHHAVLKVVHAQIGDIQDQMHGIRQEETRLGLRSPNDHESKSRLEAVKDHHAKLTTRLEQLQARAHELEQKLGDWKHPLDKAQTAKRKPAPATDTTPNTLGALAFNVDNGNRRTQPATVPPGQLTSQQQRAIADHLRAVQAGTKQSRPLRALQDTDGQHWLELKSGKTGNVGALPIDHDGHQDPSRALSGVEWQQKQQGMKTIARFQKASGMESAPLQARPQSRTVRGVSIE